MDRRTEPARIRRIVITAMVAALGVIAVVWLVGQLLGLLYMLFVALFMSVALEPAVTWLANRGWRRGIATGVVFAAAAAAAVGAGILVIPLLVSQAIQILDDLPTYLANLESLVARWFAVDLVDGQVEEGLADLSSLLSTYATDVAGTAFGVGTQVFGFLFVWATIALFAFYMVADGPRMRRIALSFLSEHRQREALRIWEIAVQKTGEYVYSRALLAIVAAVVTGVALMIIGVPGAFALGLWLGVISQLIPVVGIFIGAALPVLAALVDEPIKAVWVIVVVVAYQQLENFVIGPKITQRTMSVHPAVAIGAVLAGSTLMGGTGAILAIPVVAIIQGAVSTIIERHDVVQSDHVDAKEDRPLPPDEGLDQAG